MLFEIVETNLFFLKDFATERFMPNGTDDMCYQVQHLPSLLKFYTVYHTRFKTYPPFQNSTQHIIVLINHVQFYLKNYNYFASGFSISLARQFQTEYIIFLVIQIDILKDIGIASEKFSLHSKYYWRLVSSVVVERHFLYKVTRCVIYSNVLW